MKSMVLLLPAVLALAACSPAPAPEETDGVRDKPDAVAAAGTSEQPVSITKWGPQTTTPGVPVNPLPNGDSGLYFVVSRPIGASKVQVLFDGRPLGGVAASGDLITAALPVREITAPGAYRIILQLGPGQFAEAGDFMVTAPADPVHDGKPPAVQPDAGH